jgi:hypothetical protein
VLINQLHAGLANSVILFMVACGLWGFVATFRGGMNGSLAGALVIGEGLILAQGLLGVVSLVLGYRPVEGGLHFLYGVSMAISLPGIYTYTRGRSSQTQSLWFGAGAFFIAGMAIRGITTGRG